MTKAITPLERVKVVRISTGEVEDMLLEPSSYPGSQGTLWYNVNLDGSVPLAHYCNGHLANPKNPLAVHYALYDVEREKRAESARADITRMKIELEAANKRLLDVYKEGDA